MINRAIYTYYTDNGFNMSQGFRHEIAFLKYFQESFDNSEKYFDKVFIYTDAEGYKFLSSNGFTNKELIRFDFHSILWDKRYWNFPKLMIYNEQEKPFVHIDLDFKLLHSLSINELSAEIICERIRSVNVLSNQRENLPKEYWNSYDPVIPCSGLIGGNNIQVFKKLYTIAEKVVTKEKEIGVVVEDTHLVAIEEILLKILCNESNVKLEMLSEDSYEHLQGELKKSV